MAHRKLVIGLVVFFLATTVGGVALADIGQIKTIKGSVFLVRNDTRMTAKAGDLVQQSDVVETGADGSVGITFIDNSRFSAGPNTRIELKQFRFNPTTQEGEFVSDLNRGTLALVSGHIAKRSPEAMKIKTPTTILGVRGTMLAVKVNE